MKFLVTGAGGFIGSHVVGALLGANHSVAYVRRPESNASRLTDLDVTPIDVSRSDGRFSAGELEMLSQFHPDVVIHLGWNGVGNSERNSNEQLDNLTVSTNVLHAAHTAGAHHFVGLGSQAEYGPCEEAISEDYPLNPTTMYGAAKAATGIITGVLSQQRGMEFSWIRVFSTYGPGDEPSWMIQDVGRKILRGDVPALTLGTQKWDYLFVEDAARAICAVAQSAVGLGPVNLGSGTSVTVRHIVETLRDIANPGLDLDFGAVPFRSDQVMHLEANIAKLSTATGWQPHIGLQDGLERTVAELRRAP
jgi:UDP-glucose 4-epimerase